MEVVDTNVAVVANNSKNSDIEKNCVNACMDALINIKKRSKVAIDNGFRIIDEYRKHLSHSGQPGIGDEFFKWLWDNQGDQKHVVQIHITPRNGSTNDFEEFPDDPALNAFDPKDRKFAAVAIKSNSKVLNATDTGWWRFRDILSRWGCEVEFLCADYIQQHL